MDLAVKASAKTSLSAMLFGFVRTLAHGGAYWSDPRGSRQARVLIAASRCICGETGTTQLAASMQVCDLARPTGAAVAVANDPIPAAPALLPFARHCWRRERNGTARWRMARLVGEHADSVLTLLSAPYRDLADCLLGPWDNGTTLVLVGVGQPTPWRPLSLAGTAFRVVEWRYQQQQGSRPGLALHSGAHEALPSRASMEQYDCSNNWHRKSSSTVSLCLWARSARRGWQEASPVPARFGIILH
ncbi:hypothetical protein VTN96DRAFT_5724 [Rasamsonia emersonii]